MTIESLIAQIEQFDECELIGKVTAIRGLLIESTSFGPKSSIGGRCQIYNVAGEIINAEIVGFDNNKLLMMPYSDITGIAVGSKIVFTSSDFAIYPDESWLGRVLDAECLPIDDKGMLSKGDKAYPLKHSPPPAQKRKRVGPKLDLGIKSINCFTSMCQGQRMGIFSGSGVGKSMLISMITKFANCDIKVIGLVGERGREVQEFLQDYLGEEGLKKSIVIVATSDEPALKRRQAAYLTMSIAEYFRDRGKQVLVMLDSITRFAMAQREIGLASGEPPTSKAYPPTVYSELPKLLERAGPGTIDQGDITAFFSVLVEGDDHNEPISDAVRGILDGHITLDRQIAERGRYPAVNVLKSISRTMPACNNDEENKLIAKATYLLATYNDMADMIRIGAYKKGSNIEVDQALFYFPFIEEFLSQKPNEKYTLEETYSQLATILAKIPDQ